MALYSLYCAETARSPLTVSFRVRFRVRNMVGVRVRLFSPLRHLHFNRVTNRVVLYCIVL